MIVATEDYDFIAWVMIWVNFLGIDDFVRDFFKDKSSIAVSHSVCMDHKEGFLIPILLTIVIQEALNAGSMF